jgi:hypothetical protein
MSKWDEIVTNLRTPHLSDEASAFNYLSHISFKFDYLYVETPKVACSTIKTTLINAEIGEVVEHPSFDSLHNRAWSPLADPARVPDFLRYLERCKFKFCFVRNPYSRLLSSYLDKIAPVGERRRGPVVDYYEMEEGSEITFDQFVEYVCQQTYSSMDVHWRLQSGLLCAKYINYDFVGKFENFYEDFSSVLGRLGVAADKFYKKEDRHATAADQLLDRYYTQETKKEVYAKFFLDFDAYGYDR